MTVAPSQLVHDAKENNLSNLHKKLTDWKEFPVEVVIGRQHFVIPDYPSGVFFRAGILAACNMVNAEFRASLEAESAGSGTSVGG